jgi:hypothetical protein
VRCRFLYSAMATSLAAFIALPAVAEDAGAPAGTRPVIQQLHSVTPYDAGMTASGRPATTLLPDERDEPLRLMALVGPALAIGILTVLGLTITFSALRQDLRQRRIVYRPRHH